MIRAAAALALRPLLAAVGFYIDRAVRRLHELDSEEE